MRLIRHTRHTLAFAAACALLCAPAASAPASAAAEDEVATVRAAMSATEQRAASASTRALEAARVAEAARAEAGAAATRARDLRAAAEEDEQRVVERSERTAAVATRWWRLNADGSLAARLLTDTDPDALLTRLALLDRVGSSTARSLATARASADVAASLRDQADVAEAERERLANIADEDAARANAEAEAEGTAVETARRELDALYVRLAALRDTTPDQERSARLAEQTAIEASAPGGATGGGGRPAPPPQQPQPAPVAPSQPAPPQPAPSQPAPVSPPPAPLPPPSGVTMDPSAARAHARGAVGAYGWGEGEYGCLVSLWNRESGWRADAFNRSSGAYGIPQALPGEKMAVAGPDWRTNAATQIAWGLSYIKARYGSPCGAWAHSEATGWY